MTQVKVTVTLEDDYGVFFKETIEIPREQLVSPGMATPGILTVAKALLAASQSV